MSMANLEGRPSLSQVCVTCAWLDHLLGLDSTVGLRLPRESCQVLLTPAIRHSNLSKSEAECLLSAFYKSE